MVPVRIYDPGSDCTRPLFFFHGGGWVVCDLDTHDGITRRLALFSGRPVVSVDYRRAPEAPYPAALDDCFNVVAACVGGDVDVGLDCSRFALVGDSAGANLGLGTLLRLKQRDDVRPALGAALLYGCYDPSLSGESFETFGDGSHLVTKSEMDWYFRQYLGDHLTEPPIEVAPFREPSCLEGLPQLYIVAAECDPLSSDSRELFRLARKAGVEVTLDNWQGLIHTSAGMSRHINRVDHHLATVSVWLAKILA